MVTDWTLRQQFNQVWAAPVPGSSPLLGNPQSTDHIPSQVAETVDRPLVANPKSKDSWGSRWPVRPLSPWGKGLIDEAPTGGGPARPEPPRALQTQGPSHPRRAGGRTWARACHCGSGVAGRPHQVIQARLPGHRISTGHGGTGRTPALQILGLQSPCA